MKITPIYDQTPPLPAGKMAVAPYNWQSLLTVRDIQIRSRYKMNVAGIKSILDLYYNTKLTYKQIAVKNDCHRTTVSNIIKTYALTKRSKLK